MTLPDNSILDILISLTLIYALLSVLVSTLIEWWNHWQKSRGKMLHQSILQLLRDPLNIDYGYLFYSHYTIAGLKNSKNRPPQYISSAMFADVLIDIISQQVKKTQPIVLATIGGLKTYTTAPNYNLPVSVLDGFKLGLDSMNNSPLKNLLLAFWDKSDPDKRYEELKKLLENWYDDYMDRVSGWYKTAQQPKLIWFGFLVAMVLNVDSLHLVKILSLDKPFRNSLVAQAGNVVDQYEADKEKLIHTNEKIFNYIIGKDSTLDAKKRKEKISEIVSKLDSANKAYYLKSDSVMWAIAQWNIPVGWAKDTAPLSWMSRDPKRNVSKVTSGLTAYNEERNHPKNAWTIISYIIGICISGISLSFGAPFWFDLLIKFVNIRRAGKKPETTTNSQS